MSYKIQTIYRAVVPGFAVLGSFHQGWYWGRETAERVITNDGGARQGTVSEWDVIVMDDGDVLLAQRAKDGTNNIEKILVHGDSDEEILAATLARLPEEYKKTLGLNYDEALRVEQRQPELTRSWERNKMLNLDISAEEARVLGLAQDRDQAIADFQAIVTEQEQRRARA
jgi:hypothetical protein